MLMPAKLLQVLLVLPVLLGLRLVRREAAAATITRTGESRQEEEVGVPRR